MSNLIQIKRSTGTAAPVSLANGELAFSGQSNSLFLGSPDGGTMLRIGGGKYEFLHQAGAPGTLTVNAVPVVNNTGYMDVLKTANLYIGTVTINAINAIGNATHLGAASNSEIATSWAVKTYVDSKVSASVTTQDLTVNGNTVLGSDGSDLLTVNALLGSNVVPSANGTKNLGNTGMRFATVFSNNVVAVNGAFGEITVTGNLYVQGTLTQVDSTTLVVNDPLIELANGNLTSDTVDVGFYGQWGNSTVTQYGGLFRDQTDGIFRLFSNLQVEPTTTVDTANTTYRIGTIEAYLQSAGLVSNGTNVTITANSTLAVGITANTLSLTTQLGVASGGTGRNTLTNNAILVGNTTGQVQMIGGSSGQVAQIAASGLVEFNTLDGGTF